jgi:hypothetical protein
MVRRALNVVDVAAAGRALARRPRLTILYA